MVVLAAAGGAAALAAGCELIAGLDEDRRLGSDAGVTDADADADGPQACLHASYPDPPEGEALGGTESFVVAIHEVHFGDEAEGPVVGLDLDRTCTCQGEGKSCKTPTFAAGEKMCDGPEGRDNAASAVFKVLGTGLGLDLQDDALSGFYTKRIDDGDWSLLFRVSDYNGEDDDDRVIVELYPTTGYAGSGTMPLWDGSDEWPIPDTAYEVGLDGLPDTSRSKYVDDKAYVRGRVLVASLDAANLQLRGVASQVDISLVGGGILGTITGAPGARRLEDAMLFARWRLEDIFDALGGARNEDGEPPICKSDLVYGIAKKAICDAVDIYSESISSPTDECDSLSFGIVFAAEPALLGAVVTPEPPPGTPCPEGDDPADDKCK